MKIVVVEIFLLAFAYVCPAFGQGVGDKRTRELVELNDLMRKAKFTQLVHSPRHFQSKLIEASKVKSKTRLEEINKKAFFENMAKQYSKSLERIKIASDIKCFISDLLSSKPRFGTVIYLERINVKSVYKKNKMAFVMLEPKNGIGRKLEFLIRGDIGDWPENKLLERSMLLEASSPETLRFFVGTQLYQIEVQTLMLLDNKHLKAVVADNEKNVPDLVSKLKSDLMIGKPKPVPKMTKEEREFKRSWSKVKSLARKYRIDVGE